MKDRKFYKVVTDENKSLGLRRNPNIMQFPENEWVSLPEDQVKEGKGDWGGIWVARNRGGANTLQKYMSEKYGEETIIYEAQVGRILYENSYRVKTDKVKLVPIHE